MRAHDLVVTFLPLSFKGKTPKDCALDTGNLELASLMESQPVDDPVAHEDLETAV